MFKVIGPEPRMKTTEEGGWEVIKGSRRITWAQGDGLHLENFNGALGYANPGTIFGIYDNPVTPNRLKNIRIVFAKTTNGVFDPNDPNVSYGYRYLRRATAAPGTPPPGSSFVIDPTQFVNRQPGYPFQDFKKNVPLAVYDIDSDPPRRLAVGFLENNSNPLGGYAHGLVDGKYWPASWDTLSAYGVDNVGITGPREWLFIFDKEYSETPDPELQTDILFNPVPILYTATWNRRGNVDFSPYADYPTNYDAMEFYANHINYVTDVFEITVPSAPAYSVETAKSDLELVNAVPNPYFGASPLEKEITEAFITFTRLPKECTIRIFELPAAFELGFAYSFKIGESSLTLAGSFQNNNFTLDEYKGGLEYSFKNMLFLRVGYSYVNETDYVFNSPSFGVGFNIPLGGTLEASVEYTYRKVKFFDNNQFLTLRFAM